MTERVNGMGLTEFLLARIGEDVDTAEHVMAGLQELPHQPGSISFNGRDVYDLRRVTRELEAKRRILEIHTSSEEWTPGHIPGRFCEACAVWDEESDEGQPPTVPWPCPTLRAVAAVYADHPDYRDEWRPEWRPAS